MIAASIKPNPRLSIIRPNVMTNWLRLLMGACLWLTGYSFIHAANWNDSDIFIERRFTQTSDAAPVPASGGAFALRASAANKFSSQTQSLQLPLGSWRSSLMSGDFQLRGAHYVFEDLLSSTSEISARYAAGTFSWSISGSNSGGNVSPSLTVVQASPLDVTPQITSGTWRNGRLLVLASAPQFNIAPWSSPPTNSQIEFELWRSGGAGGQATSAGTTQITWSAQPVGAIFDAYLSYRTVLNDTTVSIPSGGTLRSRYGRAATLYFQIEVVDSLTQPVEVPVAQITNAVCVKWVSQTGKSYQVQRSTDLQTWTNFGGLITGTGATLVTYDELTGVRQFYRVVISTLPGASSLSILEALYGAGTTLSDVKSYITSAISNGTVTLTVGNSTLGGDPAPGQYKSLYVRYQTSAGTYEMTVNEGQTLQLPNPNAVQVN
jgi:hypothetical protein